MPKGTQIDPEIKAAVIKAIKQEGLTQAKASEVFGINHHTIHNWMKKQVVGSEKNYITQINQLQKKLDNAYRVIGKLTAEVDRPKDLRS